MNLLVLIYNVNSSLKNKREISSQDARTKILLRELSANISFGILLSIFIIIMILVQFIAGFSNEKFIIFFTCSLISIFIVNLFMIVKRVHVAIAEDAK